MRQVEAINGFVNRLCRKSDLTVCEFNNNKCFKQDSQLIISNLAFKTNPTNSNFKIVNAVFGT